ncbi:ATP-binding protein [Blastococcus goldschmidtiae]|uniref:histidine kinase n=1 Tax=Blastococcus goldschmidtiae TaxID=3075546 RepID=A0ABU2KDD0_9ACTN|nr:ATP-binding protein [Blastococcus sp. DSM 46792]MDT0278198.1 sensor histidine kinase [Blastococcus sp. DSM 46792]
MTLAADAPFSKPVLGLLDDLARVLRAHLPRRRPRVDADDEPTPEDAVLRALCHDMRSPLASLEAALRSLDGPADRTREMLELARAQTAQLASMLRTADAAGGAVPRAGRRLLCDVVVASVAAAGLPRSLLTVEVLDGAGDVPVADARVQRILTNLLENAHRHGEGRSVRLRLTLRGGWVRLALTQGGVPVDRVVGHLRQSRPPMDLTGLGLWSVRRQTLELGGQLTWDDVGDAFTLTVCLPDR